MRIKGIVFGAAVLGLACSGMARGQGTRPPQPETARFGNPTSIARQYQSYLFGIIKKMDKNEIILDKTRYGIDTPIKLTPKTRYIRNKKQSTREALEVGDQVYVDVKNDKKTGDKIAKKVLSGVMPGV